MKPNLGVFLIATVPHHFLSGNIKKDVSDSLKPVNLVVKVDQ